MSTVDLSSLPAPTVLEPLIVGLKQQGFCFRTLREHPQYGVAR